MSSIFIDQFPLSELAGGYRLSARCDGWSVRLQAEQEAQAVDERVEAGDDRQYQQYQFPIRIEQGSSCDPPSAPGRRLMRYPLPAEGGSPVARSSKPGPANRRRVSR